MNDLKNRLRAISKSIEQKPYLPRSICRKISGEIIELEGLTVLQPFLNGSFSEVATEDPDIAQLLRSMDTDKTVIIEILSLVNGKLIRETI